jgi:hypothetical protein
VYTAVGVKGGQGFRRLGPIGCWIWGVLIEFGVGEMNAEGKLLQEKVRRCVSNPAMFPARLVESIREQIRSTAFQSRGAKGANTRSSTSTKVLGVFPPTSSLAVSVKALPRNRLGTTIFRALIFIPQTSIFNFVY